MNTILKLTKRQTISRLKQLCTSLPLKENRQIDAKIDNDIQLGYALADNFKGNTSIIRVGVKGLFDDPKFPYVFVNDLRFTQAVVSMYHEYGHYLQNYGPEKDIPSMISEVSIINNKKYYYDTWQELPHEINAETTGINLAWDVMEKAFPGKADKCMLNYVNYRTKQTSYMIPPKQDGYQSYEEVMDAFETAMENSLTKPRTPLGRFLRYPDESIQLLTQGYENYLRSPNAYHADKLIDTMPGAQKDRMLAALVLQLHPDVLEERPLLKSENLTVEHEFGRPLKVKTLPGQHASRQIDDELAHAFETYGSTTNDYVDDFDFKT